MKCHSSVVQRRATRVLIFLTAVYGLSLLKSFGNCKNKGTCREGAQQWEVGRPQPIKPHGMGDPFREDVRGRYPDHLA